MNAFLMAFGVFLLISSGALFIAALQTRNRVITTGGMIAGAAGVIAILLGLTIVSVGANERLVVFNRVTGDLSKPREPGIAIVNPITTSYRIYDISRQNYTMSSIRFEGEIEGDDAIQTRTSGGQLVFIDLTVIYSINPDQLNEVHVNWPDDGYRAGLIRPLLRSVVRDAVSLFDVESIIQERATIDNQIEEAVIPVMEDEGFFVHDILVRNISFTDEYAASIEAAQIAEVRIREEEFRVREVEQQAAQVEARAEGAAQARIIEAQAEAEALRLVAEVLTQNPTLLEYQYIQNLTDQVQVLALPANSPFIFDLQSILENPLPGSSTSPTQTPPASGENNN